MDRLPKVCMAARPYRMHRRVLLSGLAGVWLAAPGAPAAEPAGDVEASRGECYAQTAVARRTLAPAAAIFIGDTVGTGERSGLSMRLGTATEVKLGAEARLRIDRFLVNAGGILVLEGGAMLCDHDPQVGPNELTVRSPFGLLAVRGTRFFAGPSNGPFGVFVERGEVQVVGVNTAVLVRGGSGTDIARPGAEPTMPHPWAAARIAAAMAQFNP
jgi:ferric-dicitrate binding protein FerR (iron transport regulator)